MKKYISDVRGLSKIDDFEIQVILREENQDSDVYNKYALGSYLEEESPSTNENGYINDLYIPIF